MPNERKTPVILALVIAAVALGALFTAGYLSKHSSTEESSISVKTEDIEGIQISLSTVHAELSRLSRLCEEVLRRDAELVSLVSSLVESKSLVPEEKESIEQAEQRLAPTPAVIELRMMKGDTIWGLLQRLGAEPDAAVIKSILELNGFADARRIPAGTYVRIPLEEVISGRREGD